MSKIIKWTISLGIILSFWTVISGKVCPNQKVTTYSVYKMNKLTGRLMTETRFIQKPEFICCKGYRETGRIFGGLQPKCNPICEPACGNGTCYAPNKCSCDLGYTHSADGSCVVDDTIAIRTTVSQNIVKQPSVKFGMSLNSYQEGTTQKTHLENMGPPTTTYIRPIITTRDRKPTTPYFRPARDHDVETTTPRSMAKTCGTCDQGTCVDGTCVCAPGYRKTLKGNCEPMCWQSCMNGRCVEPNRCECNKRYSYNSELHQCELTPTTIYKRPTHPTTAYFIPTRSHFVQTTTPRSIAKSCGTCDRGTCVDATCVCAPGYRKTLKGNCEPMCWQSCLNGRCVEPNRCECIDRYSYDSESHLCKPLCNGKIYGCIRGTCVGYNQCRCDNGTVLHKDELFHCVEVDRDLLQAASAFPFPWYLLILLVPAVAIVASFCIIISRWKRAKAKRVQGQEESFPEVRFHNARNEHSSTEEYQRACSKDKYLMDDPSCSQGTIRRNGNVLIINT